VRASLLDILVDPVSKSPLTLSDQKTPEKFAGQRVRVTGTLNAKTRAIQVQSMSAAK